MPESLVRPAPLEPEAVYTDGSLYFTTGLTPTTLARARRAGTLRYSRPGRRVLYLGKWVIDWLERESETAVGKEPADD